MHNCNRLPTFIHVDNPVANTRGTARMRRPAPSGTRSEDLDLSGFRIRHELRKPFIGEHMVGHGFDHRGRSRGHIGPDFGAVAHVIGAADGGREDIRLVSVIVVNLANIRDQIHPVDVQIIEPSNERRDKCGPGFCGQERLVGRETQGHVDHFAFIGQRFARAQPGPGKGHLHRDIFRDLGQFAALGNHVVGVERDHLGGDRTRHHSTDFFGHFENIPTGFFDERRVGRDPIDHPQIIEFCNRCDVCGIDKEFHAGTSLMRAALSEPLRGGVYRVANRIERGQMPEAAFFDEGTRLGVLTAQVMGGRMGVLDYLAPEGGAQLGAFVEVPLGPRKVLGVVWSAGEGGFEAAKLRSVIRVLDVPPMRAEVQAFLTRAAAYTLTPLPAMLRLATRAPGLGDPPSMRKIYRRGTQTPTRVTEARRRVLAVLEQYGALAFTLKELANAADVTPSVIKGLVAQGVVSEEHAPRDLPFPPLDPALPSKALTDAQAAAAQVLRDAQRAGGYGTALLRGVTGSGKTEVYLEAVAACLAQGRQALVLLPEIALTSDFIARVEARFGARPAEWHSGVTQTERRRVWRMVGQGAAQMVVGARSALFLPFSQLGLIVVDEEHDTSYKQEDGVLYHARDMAVLRASIEGARVILASATPALESWANAEAGKYTRVDLPARFGTAVLPEMRAIDMRAETLPSDRWISPSLEHAVKARVARAEQALLFLNRRGYAPITLCRACGHQIGCPHCDARLVEHRFLKRLVCHQCGESQPKPQACPACGAEDRLAAVGPGVERLAEEAIALFPDARVAVLSSDLFGSARALKEQIEAIAAGEADVIIGTQIVAKGHNFPNLTLVGVIDADLGLQGSDLRAAERTFQLMRQVAGRAGRAAAPGLALLQTHQPEHPVIHAILKGDEEQFWAAEAAARREMGVPPYGRMAGIVISSPDAAEAFDLGTALVRADAPLRRVGAQVFGPAPAPIARVRGRHRVRLLVKADKSTPLQGALSKWVGQFPIKGQLRLSIDIDPQSFY